VTLNFQLYVQGVNGTNVQVVEWSAIEECFLMFQDTGTLQRVSFEQTSGFGRRGAIDGRSAFAAPAKTLLRSDDPAFRARRLTGKDEAASRRPTYIVRPMISGLLCGRKLWNAIPPASAPWAAPRRAIAA